jgi:hypothetical protein
MPDGLIAVSWIWLELATTCSLVIATDLIAGHRQHMVIMNLVWPITAVYSGPMALAAYFLIGSSGNQAQITGAHQHSGGAAHAGIGGMASDEMRMPQHTAVMRRPKWQAVAVATTHCGSGCVVGDIVAEIFLSYVPVMLFGRMIFGTWAVDYVFAFVFGIAFQYFTIKPMKQLTAGEALVTAVQNRLAVANGVAGGNVGWMAIAVFGIFGQEIPKTSPVFWFMMQIAMCAGFLTSYPVTGWLVSKGIKEAM